MKARNRNAYWMLLLLAPVVCLTLPYQTGRTQEPAAPGAVFTVTNNSDAGAGTFRQSIIDANASSGTDTIQFQIGTGAVDINLFSALPDITQPVIIDGTTQPGFSETPLITLSDNSAVGLKITGGNSTVKAIAVTNAATGITVENGGSNTITGCYVGINPQDPTNGGNFENGVLINNSPNNQIGGSTAAQRNIIGNNSEDGIRITGSASTGNIITGNYIGIRAPGALARNNQSAVAIIDAPNNRVGGSVPAERNVIVGSAQGSDLPGNQSKSGILISGSTASGNIVEGNYIGTDIDGTTSVGGMRLNGVRIDNASNNRVGGTVGTTTGGSCTGACNVISGVQFRGGVYITGSGATGNSILGNFIGTNAAGTGAIANNTGVTITDGASNNTVGGTTAAARNLITNGIILTAGAATNIVQGNYIGTDTTGNVGIGLGTLFPNILVGVGINSSPNNTIGTAAGTTLGGACTGGCNLISGNNASYGVFITGAGSIGNRVDYNYIGLNAAGTTALRNGGDALTVRNGANLNIIGRPLGFSYQSTTPAPATTFLIQDDSTGNFIQFDTATRQYIVKSSRSGITRIGTVPPENVVQVGTRTRFRHNGLLTNVSATFDTATGRGSGLATLFPGAEPTSETIYIQDSNISNNIGDSPTEGMQTIVGDVGSGVNSDPNPPHHNVYNFISLGSRANGLVTLSTPIADGYLRHRAGNFNVYFNLFINTNAANFAPISLDAGTNNFITGLDISALDPGAAAFRPIVLQLGANNNLLPPGFVGVRRDLDGEVFVSGTFTGPPNSRILIKLHGVSQYESRDPAVYSDVYDLDLSFEIVTDAAGNPPFDRSYTGPDGNLLYHSYGVMATATRINEVPIASEISTTSFVDVFGDTSEMSPLAVVPKPQFDFDNDGKTDISVWRPGDGTWHILQSGGGIRVQGWGLAGDKMAPADYDGDDKTDIAVFRPGEGNWYILNSLANTVTVANWGLATDLLVPGDYNRDNRADLAVYRPSEGRWYRRDTDGQFHFQDWGLPGDKPAPADFDGDGRLDLTVFRPSEGRWYTIRSSDAGITTTDWGVSGDVPVAADYSGDGKADFVVFRPSDLTWYRRHSDDSTLHFITWGIAGDIPVPGDYDGDGKTDLAVYRPSNGTWYIFGSQAGIYSQPFGLAADLPTPSAFVY